MTNDLFGGLGGLLKGLSGFLPQDDPNVQLMNAQTEVSELKQQEDAVYAEIGRAAYGQNPGAYPAQADKLRLIQANLAEAQAALDAHAQAKQEADEQAAQAAAASMCPSCGYQSPEGVKFCPECGTKLGTSACPSCGQDNPPGTRFCGGCGHKLID